MAMADDAKLCKTHTRLPVAAKRRNPIFFNVVACSLSTPVLTQIRQTLAKGVSHPHSCALEIDPFHSLRFVFGELAMEAKTELKLLFLD